MPWGAVLAGLSAIVVAIVQYTNRVKENVTATERLNKTLDVAAGSIAREKTELDLLLTVARNEQISKDERLKAIKRLNEISPEYLGNLNLENINTKAATESVKAYTDALLKNAEAKAVADEIQKLSTEKFANDAEIEKLQKKIDTAEKANKSGMVNADLGISGYEKRINELQEANTQIEESKKVYTSFYEKTFEQAKTVDKNTQFYREQDLAKNKKYLDTLEKQYAEAYLPLMKTSKISFIVLPKRHSIKNRKSKERKEENKGN